MKNDEILYSVADRIATITFNRPEARNAFGDTTRDRLEALLNEAESDNDVRCVIITGAGSAFAAGGDVKGMGELQAGHDTQVLAQRMQVATRVVLFIRTMKTPVIAAINGAAAGGALNLALACDIRYASDNAIFSQSFVKIGLVPDWGGHYLLTQIVGSGRAMELMMLGDAIDSTAALRLGIVNEVFPVATFREQVQLRAQKLAGGPRDALAAIKQGVYAGCTQSLADILAFEQATQIKAFLSDDGREGVRAFIEKRAPNFN
jgi:2-(1,2-epoxy-1,2-dihydrophenyl)acetyl-CoA isomerase